jgi:NAD(P)-dependent dehydrogenase (short-subunit alcohol dehydrogenase family)
MPLVAKNAIVTGGASGIGLATRRRLARDNVSARARIHAGVERVTSFRPFTKSPALELAPTGVTVNNIPPGFVDTPMLQAARASISGGIAGQAANSR